MHLLLVLHGSYRGPQVPEMGPVSRNLPTKFQFWAGHYALYD